MNELRTVDIFDGNTGEMVCQLYDPNASGIISVSWALQLKVFLSIDMQPRERFQGLEQQECLLYL